LTADLHPSPNSATPNYENQGSVFYGFLLLEFSLVVLELGYWNFFIFFNGFGNFFDCIRKGGTFIEDIATSLLIGPSLWYWQGMQEGE